MKLYTGIGDDGQTNLFDGSTILKNDIRVAAYGDVDELNSAIGWAAVAVDEENTKTQLTQIQNDLFHFAAELATVRGQQDTNLSHTIGEKHCRRLEDWIDQACEQTETLTNFILPGGCESGARLHLVRTVCRRAERTLVQLANQATVRRDLIVYLNRLGDLLFAWARLANQQANCPETIWKADNTHPD